MSLFTSLLTEVDHKPGYELTAKHTGGENFCPSHHTSCHAKYAECFPGS